MISHGCPAPTYQIMILENYVVKPLYSSFVLEHWACDRLIILTQPPVFHDLVIQSSHVFAVFLR